MNQMIRRASCSIQALAFGVLGCGVMAFSGCAAPGGTSTGSGSKSVEDLCLEAQDSVDACGGDVEVHCDSLHAQEDPDATVSAILEAPCEVLLGEVTPVETDEEGWEDEESLACRVRWTAKAVCFGVRPPLGHRVQFSASSSARASATKASVEREAKDLCLEGVRDAGYTVVGNATILSTTRTCE
jgi:hypothetical protein